AIHGRIGTSIEPSGARSSTLYRGSMMHTRSAGVRLGIHPVADCTHQDAGPCLRAGDPVEPVANQAVIEPAFPLDAVEGLDALIDRQPKTFSLAFNHRDKAV